MQLTSTTDYAIRIISYLTEKNGSASANELSDELNIPNSYIPKIIKNLKNNHLINATEGMKGGYSLAKSSDEISLYDVISSTEVTMAINKCLETNGVCSRNCIGTCRIRKILFNLQTSFNYKLQSITFRNILNDESKQNQYLLLKIDLNTEKIEIINRNNIDYDFLDDIKIYTEFVTEFLKQCVCREDKFLVKDFLLKSMNDNFDYQDIDIRFKTNNNSCMNINKHINQNIMFLTFKIANIFTTIDTRINRSSSEQNDMIENEFWNMISLLELVLAHNKLEEPQSIHNISYFTEQIYKEVQLNYPKLNISDEEIENVSKLATIHDIGKLFTPYEILNKKGKLTKDEMDIIKKHPLNGANMALKLPKCGKASKLVQYAYNICLYHHERYDGQGYPKGLIGDEIPLEAQVVGLADAYDALISERPYKRKINHGEAVRMIVNGECGSFSPKVILSFIIASMNKTWIEKVSK